MEIEKTKSTQTTTFKTDMIKVVLVFSISTFFCKKKFPGKEIESEKKIPTFGNSALGTKSLYISCAMIEKPGRLHLKPMSVFNVANMSMLS